MLLMQGLEIGITMTDDPPVILTFHVWGLDFFSSGLALNMALLT